MAKSAEFAKKEKEREKEEGLRVKVASINRCSKVVKGGRQFSFSALILVGDGQGRVGYGFAKANELTDAIRKAETDARKRLIVCPKEGTTIPHEVMVHWDGVTIMLKPAPKGTGVVAGSKVRDIFELLGVADVVAKNLGGNNPINQVKATFKAIEQLASRATLKQERAAEGLSV